jgi:energy-converting hydrogenase B subunit D
MNTLTVLLVVLGAIMLVVGAWYVLTRKDLLVATIASSIISLVLSVFFLILQAPDVALTEATIGVALTTIIFVVTIRNTKRQED